VQKQKAIIQRWDSGKARNLRKKRKEKEGKNPMLARNHSLQDISPHDDSGLTETTEVGKGHVHDDGVGDREVEGKVQAGSSRGGKRVGDGEGVYTTPERAVDSIEDR